MDAQTFFGYESGSNLFDSRRHINIVFTAMLEYNLSLVSRDEAVPVIQRIMSIRDTDENEAAQIVKSELLNPIQYQFLNCLKRKYYISDDEFTTILSCVYLTARITKSPAGYSKSENLILISQLILATAFFHQSSNQIQSYFNSVAQLAAGMRGPITKNDFDKVVHLTSTACEMYGNQPIDNYNKIENYIKANI